MSEERVLLHLAKSGVSWGAVARMLRLGILGRLPEDPGVLERVKGIRKSTVERIRSINWHTPLEELKGKHPYISILSPLYPERLKRLKSPPYVLFYRGNLELLNLPGVAIVGSRKASPRGRELARKTAREAAARGEVVISGLALGIDTAAHRGALDAGSTIAVLGSALDRVYPSQNRGLFEEIASRGLVLSPFFPGTPPARHNFPARNSVIAALSSRVVVVEAGSRSGALITAKWAFSLKIPVLTYRLNAPGNAKLLEEGAIAVDPEDKPSSGESDPIAGLLAEKSPLSIDEMAQLLNIDIPKLQARLLELELEGRVRRIAGGFYEKG